MTVRFLPNLVLCLAFVSILLSGCRESMTCEELLPIFLEVPCEAGPDEIQFLERGAKQLALRQIQEENGPLADSVRIPESAWMPYAEAWAAVRAAISQVGCTDLNSLTETVPFPRAEMDGILLEVDATQAWVQEWVNGNSLTGNPQIDALMQEYNLTLIDYYDWSIGDHVAIAGAEPLNLAALIELFVPIDGIVSGFENSVVGDGNDIKARIEGDEMLMEIWNSYGDCPAGCIHDEIWTFRVFPDCRVAYEGFREN